MKTLALPMIRSLAMLLFLFTMLPAFCDDTEKIQQGSQTARAGFQNEDDVRQRFDDWKSDTIAQSWLATMGYKLTEIQALTTSAPHGAKADIEIHIKTEEGDKAEGISIKLVSSLNGFNQVDKRWLKTYAEKWDMPQEVVDGMKLYLGEIPPTGPVRRDNRMYLDELPDAQRDAILKFFTNHKQKILQDLIVGQGDHTADWFLVCQKVDNRARWVIRSAKATTEFFAKGPVRMTRAGNLKLGQVSMQRKGGDNGRPTANMLQFKMNPALLFDADQ